MILKIIKLESSTEVEKFSIELQRIIEVGKRSWKSKLERTRNLKVLSLKLRNEIGNNEVGKFQIKLESYY